MAQNQRKLAGSKNDRDTTKFKAKTGPGRKKLGKKVDKAIGRKSQQIADKLVDKAVAGDINVTKFLVTLSDQTDWGVVSTGRRRVMESLAERLAAEPEWTGNHDKSR